MPSSCGAHVPRVNIKMLMRTLTLEYGEVLQVISCLLTWICYQTINQSINYQGNSPTHGSCMLSDTSTRVQRLTLDESWLHSCPGVASWAVDATVLGCFRELEGVSLKASCSTSDWKILPGWAYWGVINENSSGIFAARKLNWSVQSVCTHLQSFTLTIGA